MDDADEYKEAVALMSGFLDESGREFSRSLQEAIDQAFALSDAPVETDETGDFFVEVIVSSGIDMNTRSFGARVLVHCPAASGEGKTLVFGPWTPKRRLQNEIYAAVLRAAMVAKNEHNKWRLENPDLL